MNIPNQLLEDFQEWNKNRRQCPFTGNYCLLTGSPCSYLHCLFRTGQLVQTYAQIPCPKCGNMIKYPLETKCSCGFDFTQPVGEQAKLQEMSTQ